MCLQQRDLRNPHTLETSGHRKGTKLRKAKQETQRAQVYGHVGVEMTQKHNKIQQIHGNNTKLATEFG